MKQRDIAEEKVMKIEPDLVKVSGKWWRRKSPALAKIWKQKRNRASTMSNSI